MTALFLYESFHCTLCFSCIHTDASASINIYYVYVMYDQDHRRQLTGGIHEQILNSKKTKKREYCLHGNVQDGSAAVKLFKICMRRREPHPSVKARMFKPFSEHKISIHYDEDEQHMIEHFQKKNKTQNSLNLLQQYCQRKNYSTKWRMSDKADKYSVAAARSTLAIFISKFLSKLTYFFLYVIY